MKNVVLTALIAFLLVAACFYYYKYQETQKLLRNPREVVKTEVEDLIAKVGKLIVLPKDEAPTIATVQDKTKLKSQAFFAKAENGDKVLIYIKAKRAILYRPSTNKIIEVAPISVGKNSQSSSSATLKPTTKAPAPTTAAASPTKAE